MGKPKAPDYKGAAEAQAASDKVALEYQTAANRPDQNNPWGNVKWSQDDEGNWTQDTTLNEASQGVLDSQLGMMQDKSDLAQGMMGRLGSEFGNEMDWNKFGDPTSLEFNPDEIRQKAEDAAYSRATSRLDPRFAESDTSLEVSLRNRGLSEGDEAFDSAMANQAMSKTDAYTAAQDTAVGQGRAESDQMFQQQKQQADYANNLRQSQMSEEMKKRGFSLNEINAIMSGQQVAPPEFQSFTNAGRGAATNYSAAAQSQGNFDQAAYQSMLGGAGDMFSAGMGMFCDRRLKTNIKKVGEFLGFPFYTFDYLWGEKAAGVMADEVNPEAVSTHSSGFSVVDYSKLNSGGV